MRRETVESRYEILVEGPHDAGGSHFMLVCNKDQKYALLYAVSNTSELSFLDMKLNADGRLRCTSAGDHHIWYKSTGYIMDRLDKDDGNRDIFIKFKQKVKEYLK